MSKDAATPVVVYYDGSCPICRAEIGHYASQSGAEQLCFLDLSKSDAPPAPDLTHADAMARFHVRQSNGALVSGADAMVAIWRTLPGWRWVARIASFPGLRHLLEGLYRVSLWVRPSLSRIVNWFVTPRST